jgi:hypothetical protein
MRTFTNYHPKKERRSVDTRRATRLDLAMLAVLGNRRDHTGLIRCMLHAADIGLGVGRVRDPLARGARRRLLEHAVDLLEAQALGLGDEEVREEHAGGAGGAPDEEDLGLEVTVVGVDHVRGDEADDEVPEPVGGGLWFVSGRREGGER